MMFRILVVIAIIFAAEHALACEKPKDPSTDCWNPPTKYVDKGLRRFYAISQEIDEALFVNDLASIQALSEEYLKLAKIYVKNWNYGNAIHDANIALGTIELRRGNHKKAGQFLVEAGKSTGSPQLNSFGPDLTLANVLLKKGEIESVLQYLEGVKTFWKMDQGRIKLWIEAINKGEKPALSKYPM